MINFRIADEWGRSVTRSAFPSKNPLIRSSAVSSPKMFRSEEALGLPGDGADYFCTAGFAARTSLKLVAILQEDQDPQEHRRRAPEQYSAAQGR